MTTDVLVQAMLRFPGAAFLRLAPSDFVAIQSSFGLDADGDYYFQGPLGQLIPVVLDAGVIVGECWPG